MEPPHLDRVIAEGKAAIEPTHEAFLPWNEKVDARMPDMIWTHPKANSYYNNSKDRVYPSFPFRLVDYWTWTRAPNPGAFPAAVGSEKAGDRSLEADI
jgi:4-hydroxyacetophenone monooxygenase